MKRIFIIIFLTSLFQYSFGQSCGIYNIRYIAELTHTDSIKIEKIKLPPISFLHGLEKNNSENLFLEIIPTHNKINKKLTSHTTSHLFSEAERLEKFYKTKNEFVPITFEILLNGKRKKIIQEFYWKDIKITKLENDGFGNLFEFNFGKINLN